MLHNCSAYNPSTGIHNHFDSLLMAEGILLLGGKCVILSRTGLLDALPASGQ